MKESLYNGFKRIDFEFQGREAILVFPPDDVKTDKWLLKTEYFDAFPNAEIALAAKGFHIAFLSNNNGWGGRADQDAKLEFAKYLHKEYGLSKKCVPVGMSCGGLHALRLAQYYPEMVSMLYLDAPVMNFLSCPMGMGVGQPIYGSIGVFMEEYGLKADTLLTYRDHPIDNMAALIENNLPVLLVYGDSDTVVPYCENGAILEKYYKEHGGKILAIGKEGCGHHPHGLSDPAPIVDFIIENS